VTEEKSLECLLTVKSGEKSMTLTIGEEGLDTEEWNESFKSHFPNYPEGEYEVSFTLNGEKFPLGTYEAEILFEVDESDSQEAAIQMSISLLGFHVFSNLLNAVMCILLQETVDLFDETLELMVLHSVLSGIDIEDEFEEEEEEE